MFENFCLENCPIGYYGSSGTCSACPVECLSCTSINICTGCDTAIYVLDPPNVFFLLFYFLIFLLSVYAKVVLI